MAEHNEIGKKGEDIASIFLKNKGFSILTRNFHVKLGELDIIATKDKINTSINKNRYFHVKPENIYFFEVKTKKIDNFEMIKDMSFRPEYNLTKTKRQRILKAIRQFLAKNDIKESDLDIFISAIIVFLNTKEKKAKVQVYENLPLF